MMPNYLGNALRNGCTGGGLAVMALVASCAPGTGPEQYNVMEEQVVKSGAGEGVALFGAGCFWCVEAVFSELKGVQRVEPGYAGGHVQAPDYRAVCTGTTGHAEVIRIHFDPQLIAYERLLEVFWATHDPTTKDRQGHDVGTQYRSVIFPMDEAQRRMAEEYRTRLDASGAYPAPIVTTIEPTAVFWPAEPEHLNYYARNPEQGYCSMVIRPKLEKFREAFPTLTEPAR